MRVSILEPTWYVLRVATGHELHTAELLRQKGYEEFTPSYVVRRQWVDRIKQIHLALFPGYIFCRCDPEMSSKAVMTPGVLRIVSFCNQPAVITEEQISTLKALVASGLKPRPWPYLHCGDMVELQAGPLRGARGRVVCCDDECKLVVSIELLQRSVAVTVDREWVSPDRPSRTAARQA